VVTGVGCWTTATQSRAEKLTSALAEQQLHGVDDGDSASLREVASREVAAASREAASRLGSLTAQNQISPRLGFRVGRGTPLIPGILLVSADVIQPIPKILFMVSADVIQSISIIICIGWLTSVDTNKARAINTAHTPLFWPSTQWRWLLFRPRELFRPRLSPFLRYFSTFSNMCLRLFCHSIYRSWF
jgi:hypothetical protein